MISIKQRYFINMVQRIEIIKGDITTQMVDAIVNAANTSLLGGGGVDGAIHRAAGKELLEECRTLNGCRTGEAKITKGYKLPAKFVIHTAGPVWKGGKENEANLLRNCYQNSLQIACDKKLTTIAFPAISTGVYGYPIEDATYIALTTVISFLKESELPQKVVFVCFSDSDLAIYIRTFNAIANG